MPTQKKTDNKNLELKLELRRRLLRQYHADGDIRVFDACQGTGQIWKRLRREFPLSSYWGVDKKQAKGRLKIDSVRVLASGVSENVIDVDTYGFPWEHYELICFHLRQPTTVFLTIGQPTIATCVPGIVRRVLNLPDSTPRKLASLAVRNQSIEGCLTELSHGHVLERVLYCRHRSGSTDTKYLGVRILPRIA